MATFPLSLHLGLCYVLDNTYIQQNCTKINYFVIYPGSISQITCASINTIVSAACIYCIYVFFMLVLAYTYTQIYIRLDN